ncbi:hypothetical protein SELMODRAFT_413847 [Selaginella moellendorffii]|uniref:ATPase domain-containing protein n=1 Tax=Selaginella moellendorffii TaxID=88036 RepID=D8RQE4_SELML|nr:hypothetical protein SELMODRAFT_413847 [Selaginella moellendorffii]
MGACQSVTSAELGQSIRSVAGAVQSSYGFFNRKEELERLVRILDAEPLQINVLLGPKDAGKSLLLTHLRELWKSSAGRSALAPLVIIDMRINDCSSPDAMAALLRTELGGWQKQVRDLLGRLSSSTRLTSSPSGKAVYDKELDDLLGFMEGMTKQTGRAHVVMASSDEFFRSWLRRKFADGKFKTIGLGLFCEDEAKQFFSEHVAPTLGLKLPQDWEATVWPSIFEAAGGSPYQLKTLALNASLDNDEDATNLVAQAQDLIDVARVNLEMTMGLGEGWTPAELTGIFKAIVEGGGAAAYRTVVAEVFGGQIHHGNRVVHQQLVRSNIIHVRLLTKATKYRDVPAQHTATGEYLMATSPAAYAAMKLCCDVLT